MGFDNWLNDMAAETREKAAEIINDFKPGEPSISLKFTNEDWVWGVDNNRIITKYEIVCAQLYHMGYWGTFELKRHSGQMRLVFRAAIMTPEERQRELETE